MKRKVLYIISLITITFSFTACEALGDCEVCRYASYDSNSGTTSYYGESEYCGTELLVMKTTKSWTDGTVTTSVECD